jgi:hypothetical protein
LLLLEVIGLQSRRAGWRSAITNQRDIRGPQFLEQEPAWIAGGGAEVARTGAEAKTIEGCHRASGIRADRHCRPVAQTEHDSPGIEARQR